MKGEKLKYFLVSLLSISIIVIFIDIINVGRGYEHYYKIIISFTALILTIHYIFKNQLDQCLTFIIIGVLFNPFYTVNLQPAIWRILELPIMFLLAHRIYIVLFEKQLKEIEITAYLVDRYLKELERTISSLSYPQISIYIHKRYPEKCKINQESITWAVNEIPDVEFEILMAFYSLGKQSKGGVNAKFINKYQNIEAHLNFNLSALVRYSVIVGKGNEQKPNRLARHIKRLLIVKYHYLDL